MFGVQKAAAEWLTIVDPLVASLSLGVARQPPFFDMFVCNGVFLNPETFPGLAPCDFSFVQKTSEEREISGFFVETCFSPGPAPSFASRYASLNFTWAGVLNISADLAR